MAIGEGSSSLENDRYHTQLWKGKEDVWNISLVRPTSFPKKVLEAILKHVKDERWLGKPAQISQAETMLDQALFYDEKTTCMDDGRGVDVVSLDFSKAFATLSKSVLIVILVKYSSSRLYWLYFLAQKIWMNSGNSNSDQVQVVFSRGWYRGDTV